MPSWRPIVFEHVVEYPLTLILAAMLLPQIAGASGSVNKPHPKRRARPQAEKRKGPVGAGPRAAPYVLDALLPAAMLAVVALLVSSLLESDQGLTWASRVVAFGAPAAASLAFIAGRFASR